MKKTVIVVVGPTASGKSLIGIELAKRLDGVVISADSMQIYKKLDIGTAKVTDEEASGIKHELIDIVDVSDKFSVSDYKDLCYEKIEQIFESNKVPIIVGGTGLYVNAVVNNMTFEKTDENKEKKVLEELKVLTQGKNSSELYEILKSMDYEAASKIDLGNDKRVLRAIKLSLLGSKKSVLDLKNDLWHKNESKYEFLTIYIDMPRDLLYDRINKRVDKMASNGILEEAKYLYSLKDKGVTAVQAIGYKEFFGFIENRETLENCINLLKQKTRNYAKRQITWFKKLEDKIEVDGTKSKEKIVEEILKEYYERFKQK